MIGTDPEQVEFVVLELGKGVDQPTGSLVAVVEVGLDIDSDSDSDSVHPASLGI